MSRAATTSASMAVAVGTPVTPKCLLEMMLVITAEAQILLAGDEAVELRKQERSSEVSAMVAACSIRTAWVVRCAGSEDLASA